VIPAIKGRGVDIHGAALRVLINLVCTCQPLDSSLLLRMRKIKLRPGPAGPAWLRLRLFTCCR
jgi:hypothetical protein